MEATVPEVEFPMTFDSLPYAYVKFVRNTSNGYLCLYRNTKTNEIVYVKMSKERYNDI